MPQPGPYRYYCVDSDHFAINSGEVGNLNEAQGMVGQAMGHKDMQALHPSLQNGWPQYWLQLALASGLASGVNRRRMKFMQVVG